MATEKRLIDANELIEVLRKSNSYHAETSREFSLLFRDIRLVKEQPTVDAVEVVRCKNCSFWKRHTKTEKFYGACNRYGTTKHENGFCDKGEMRTDG